MLLHAALLMRRLLCIALALVLAAMAARDAALAHWRSAGSGMPPSFLTDDPVLRLRAADGRMDKLPKQRDNAPAIGQAARALLRQTPLDSAALRSLAISEGPRGAAGSQALIALAERVSRRDAASELLLIDAAARQGNVAQTLRHYDHLLTVFPETRQQLFPRLASELAEPAVREALLPLASRPWLRDFVVNAIDHDVAPAYLMDFYDDLGDRVPVAELQAGAVRIIKWLVARNQTAVLGEYADRIPGLAPQAFAPLGFSAITLDPRFTPLSWEFFQSDVVGTELDGEKLDIRVSPENSAWAALRLTWLAPGRFDLTQTVSYLADSPRARLEWHVTCIDSNLPPLLQQALPRESSGARVTAQLVVPDGCPTQLWHLRASADRAQIPAQARVSGLDLVRR